MIAERKDGKIAAKAITVQSDPCFYTPADSAETVWPSVMMPNRPGSRKENIWGIQMEGRNETGSADR